ncbi:glutathione S-transferase family protein [Pendulispora albinea]|uniref:Glutathione S-transferase family protein n=1 Tax=Pendulispora albinea TaxID=2741071 RepID=A0ABZ2M139_9BACT
MEPCILSDKMKLYEFPYAPNPRRVRIFMAEKGIDLPRVAVDVLGKETRTAEFSKINSLGQVPVLQLEDGTLISESVAICRYLEELRPAPALFGSDAKSRAQVEMWNRRMESEIFGTIGNVGLHSDEFFKGKIAQVPAFSDAQRKAAPEKWAWLDRELADGRPFIAGEQFSVADITGMVASWLGGHLKIEIPASLTHVHRWHERMRARPSWSA